MKVLYDYQIFDNQKFGGISRSFVELISHLPNKIKKEIGVFETNNIHLNNLGYHQYGEYYQNFIKKGEFPSKRRIFDLWNKIKQFDYWNYTNKQYSINLIKKGDYNIFHPTFFDNYFLNYLNKKPFVLTIHDMIPEKYPQYFDHKDDFQIRMKKQLAPLASAIIAVSNKTKEDIINILKIPENKIHVIYHGCNTNIEVNTIQEFFSFPYILYVGERGMYKNFIPWLYSTKTVLNRFKDIKVVCTGNPFNNQEQEIISKLGLENRFVHHFVNTDKELFSIYHNAICFVYTSEYEGFGIPILEAYQAQCPILLNNASCFPEIAGDAAIYFTLKENGDSDFSEVFMEFYLSNQYDKKQLIVKQNERLKLYSWNQSAQNLLDVYRHII